jgi:hypothetical protein
MLFVHFVCSYLLYPLYHPTLTCTYDTKATTNNYTSIAITATNATIATIDTYDTHATKHRHSHATLLTRLDPADILTLYYVIVHETEARCFPKLNIRGRHVIEDRHVLPFKHPKHVTPLSGVFIITHELSINIANKEQYDIIMSRQQPCGFDHLLSFVSILHYLHAVLRRCDKVK